jgi:hypothetical protein
MILRILAIVLTVAAADLVCLGADDPKPACTERLAGQLWPEAANRDPLLRKKMARCGELEMCTRGLWRYHWEALTVRLDQLRGGSQLHKPAGCEQTAETSLEANPRTAARP